jgi:hypothetical protein
MIFLLSAELALLSDSTLSRLAPASQENLLLADPSPPMRH